MKSFLFPIFTFLQVPGSGYFRSIPGRNKSGAPVLRSCLPPALPSVFPPAAAHKADPATRARGPPFRARRSWARREDRALPGCARPGPLPAPAPQPDPAQRLAGRPSAQSPGPHAPPCRLPPAAVVWGAAGGRGSVTALRRALGGIVAVSAAGSGPDRGPTLRAPRSKRSLRLSSGGAGGERERSVPVSAASPPLPQVTRCKEQRCASCGFCSAGVRRHAGPSLQTAAGLGLAGERRRSGARG